MNGGFVSRGPARSHCTIALLRTYLRLPGLTALILPPFSENLYLELASIR